MSYEQQQGEENGYSIRKKRQVDYQSNPADYQ
jgi:hypothetical protein